MGAFLDTPKTDKYNEHGEGNGLKYGVASMQGWRLEMEDAHQAITGLEGGLEDWSFFAVFDGHAGAKVSAHSAEHLLECIMQTEEFKAEDVIRGIHSGFLRLDDKMRGLPEMCDGTDKSGSTARVNGLLAVSRALGDYEYKNVEGRGPCEQLVSPEPEIFVRDRDDQHDEFLVLACDGIWDVMTNENLCNFIHSRLLLTDDLEAVTNEVIDTCLYKGSRDNMSIVLITFPAAPKPNIEAKKKEAELDMFIERTIKGSLSIPYMYPLLSLCCCINRRSRSRAHIVSREADKKDFVFLKLLHMLMDQGISNLPPGGGLPAKQKLIENVFREVCPSKADSIGLPYDYLLYN
ncbi:hypothetical protein TSAR_001379 [Trichomalopsis sarcophagae]|uniref:PPM-type phosphatase domain-containing protein n=1 Tax=Trichomalopsis sarcophagae TaxID=543379 RepID=A0A232ETG6_9HYME|nr:hypothetical protein TSAR_001379 [Trichomalopsis sarcophagae]